MTASSQEERDYPTGLRPPVLDHVESGFARQLEQDKDDPRFQAVLGAVLAKLQEISEVLDQLQVALTLKGPIPTFLLDNIGKLLKIPRSMSWDDDTYRAWLRARIAARRSSGTYPEVLEVAYLCRRVGASAVRVYPIYPKAFRIEIPHIQPEDYEITKQILQSAVTTTTQIDVVSVSPGIGFFFDNAAQGLDNGRLQTKI